MNLKSSVMTAALIASLAAPAGARTLEAHDTWGTTCHPVDGPAFYMEMDSYAGGNITIYGAKPWPNKIYDVTNIPADNAFGVEGAGMGYHGMRVVTVVLGEARTLLAINHDVDHMIYCDNAHGVSHD
jgi:hypothetical protein